MPASLLAQIGITPAQLANAPAELRLRVVDFLIRWESFAEASSCLALIDRADAAGAIRTARVWQGLGYSDQAIEHLKTHLAGPHSQAVRRELCRLHLAANSPRTALDYAKKLTTGDAGVSPDWVLLADALRHNGAIQEAKQLLLRQGKLAPRSRAPLLGLMRLYHDQHDDVVATAYAVQAMETAKAGLELAVDEMAELHTFFLATHDSTNVAELKQLLLNRYERETAELRIAVAPFRPQPAAQKLRRLLPSPKARALPAPPEDVEVSQAVLRTLRKGAEQLFGHQTLLPKQAEVMACVKRGENVFAILPTGAGKSLCYQLPAFQGEGITLVISPLIALMKDQMDGLPPKLKRQAIAINSSLDGDELQHALRQCAAGAYRLVYAAPERLRQASFVHGLRSAGLARMVIDEAHCISAWGHDFRPDYLHLAHAHRDLGAPPLLAMTATAPQRVRDDITQQLFGGIDAPRLIATDSFRPNLRLTVLHARDDDERRQRLIDLVQQLAGAGVVYAQSRQQCEELATLLRSHGVVAGHYHAGVEDRGTLQDRFMQNEIRVIVATVAFGMGVDKPDIRWIIHIGLPGSVEAYYQEIGRAGRDGATADCVLLHCLTDDQRLLRLSQQSSVGLENGRAMLQLIVATLGAAGVGPVTLPDLAQATNGDQATARAVLCVLELAGLVRRHYDAPDHVLLRRGAGKRKRQPDSACLQFMHRIGLATHDAANGAFVTLAAKAGIPLVELETTLLHWQDQGWLQYFPSGRRLLLSLVPSHNESDGQINRILEQRRAATAHRVQGIIDFVNSTHCRHGALADYLGDTTRNCCNICDNCGAGLVLHVSPASAALAQQTITVLRALAEQSWGKRTLVRLLHGDAAASERAHESTYFGALSDRSEQSLSQLVDSLIAEGLIVTRTLSHGGATLELSHRGQQTLHQRPGPRSITGRR